MSAHGTHHRVYFSVSRDDARGGSADPEDPANMISSTDIERNGFKWMMADEFTPTRVALRSPMILNTDAREGPGQHWIVIVKLAPRRFYLADSLGANNKRLTSDGKPIIDGLVTHFGRMSVYPHAVQQKHDVLCGFHALYIAQTLRDTLHDNPDATVEDLNHAIDAHYIDKRKSADDSKGAKRNATVIQRAFGSAE